MNPLKSSLSVAGCTAALGKASRSENAYSELVRVIRECFPCLQTHDVGEHVEVNSGSSLLAIRIVGPDEFKTSQNRHVNVPLIQITSAPTCDARSLFNQLSQINGPASTKSQVGSF